MERMISGLSLTQTRKIVGVNLSELRRYHHLSQRDLAGEDCSPALVSRIEKGRTSLSEELAVAFAFRISMEPSRFWELMLDTGEGEDSERRTQDTDEDTPNRQDVVTETAGEKEDEVRVPAPSKKSELAFYRSLVTCNDCGTSRSALPRRSWVIKPKDNRPRCNLCYKRYLLGEPPVVKKERPAEVGILSELPKPNYEEERIAELQPATR